MKLKITLGLLLLTQITMAQTKIERVDSLLKSLYSTKKINGNFLIAEKGKIIYQQSFGFANETTQEILSENAVFELASCSKQFTAMAIMQLKEKGKLKLDDNFTKYIPELSNYKGVSIRNLLNHTGGLPEYMLSMYSLFDKSKIATNKDIIDIFSMHKPKVLFKPNTKYEYSNTGYALLAVIIERLSGTTFAKYLEKNIFGPLQMKNTFVYNRRLLPKKIANYAYGYVYIDSLKKYILPDEIEQTKMVIWLDGVVGDGTVNSTVIDLLKWDRALYTHRLLSSSGMKEIFEVATLKDKSKSKYGFGWGIDDNVDFGKIVRHTGGWPGYNTQIDRHITNDKIIIILQNHDDAVNPIQAIRSILYNMPLPVEKVKTEIALTTEQLQKLVGVYEIQEGFDAKVTLENNQLYGQLPGQEAYPLFAESELLFFLKVTDAQVQFEKDEKGNVTKFYVIQGGNKTAAKRKK